MILEYLSVNENELAPTQSEIVGIYGVMHREEDSIEEAFQARNPGSNPGGRTIFNPGSKSE